jgi:3D (Asp-Asp-Asp) domain-containing protein
MSLPSRGGRSLRQTPAALLLALGISSGCALWRPPAPERPPERPPAPEGERSLAVTATAYNSLRGQTDGHPGLGAWGDTLRPGVRAIAVSEDLVELGLVRGTPVRIEGLPGEYQVLDKMGRRWRKRIDIYMGVDVEAAQRWGRRQVLIYWRAPPGS